MIKIKYLLALLAFLEIGDGLLTYFLVGNGIAREGNPFLVPYVGESNFVLIKVVGALVCVLLLWDVYRRFPKVALVVTSLATAFYGAVVAWNLTLVLTAGQSLAFIH